METCRSLAPSPLAETETPNRRKFFFYIILFIHRKFNFEFLVSYFENKCRQNLTEKRNERDHMNGLGLEEMVILQVGKY